MLHICCAPCAAHCIEALQPEGEVLGAFVNPNVQPEEEYLKRLDEARRLAARYRIKFIEAPYDADGWKRAVAGLTDEPEGGARCEVCFRVRLAEAVRIASQEECDFLTTTLTISPHKNAAVIHRIGREVSGPYGIAFRTDDFKKKHGFKKSMELSRLYGLYRQNYCGCLMSRRGK